MGTGAGGGYTAVGAALGVPLQACSPATPVVFVSYGARDRVLLTDRCSHRIVPRLQREGYEVRYREFDGPHTVPRPVAREALEWFMPNREANDEGQK